MRRTYQGRPLLCAPPACCLPAHPPVLAGVYHGGLPTHPPAGPPATHPPAPVPTPLARLPACPPAHDPLPACLLPFAFCPPDAPPPAGVQPPAQPAGRRASARRRLRALRWVALRCAMSCDADGLLLCHAVAWCGVLSSSAECIANTVLRGVLLPRALVSNFIVACRRVPAHALTTPVFLLPGAGGAHYMARTFGCYVYGIDLSGGGGWGKGAELCGWHRRARCRHLRHATVGG